MTFEEMGRPVNSDDRLIKPAPSFEESIRDHRDIYELVCAVDQMHPTWSNIEQVFEVQRLLHLREKGN